MCFLFASKTELSSPSYKQNTKVSLWLGLKIASHKIGQEDRQGLEKLEKEQDTSKNKEKPA